jgi:hypothetical protein
MMELQETFLLPGDPAMVILTVPFKDIWKPLQIESTVGLFEGDDRFLASVYISKIKR